MNRLFLDVPILSVFVVDRWNEFESCDEALCDPVSRFGYEMSSRFMLSLEPAAEMRSGQIDENVAVFANHGGHW